MAYTPRRSAEGYPGLDLPPERQEALRRLTIDVGDLTAEDLVHSLSKSGSGTFFLLMGLVTERFGATAAQDLARCFGAIVGRANYRKMQRRFGVERLGPEQLAEYEDTVHVLGGVDMADCFTSYDEHECRITRTRCAFHAAGVPGGDLCPSLNEGFAEAYAAHDPDLVEMTYDVSLARGDDHCEHVFRWRA